ncbi:hypothetical protein L484_009498 [Morus notabilis]|uniref:Uncharacterized protein n=1 Tax=Morus notabilis TaxID=981085 RepID=W9RSJ1_9ROSA|nr:hypothetical protein L484_009498 [Morus notabilis]
MDFAHKGRCSGHVALQQMGALEGGLQLVVCVCAEAMEGLLRWELCEMEGAMRRWGRFSVMVAMGDGEATMAVDQA